MYFFFCLDLPSLFFIGYLLEAEPEFAEPINNVTVAIGRDAQLSCTVENLGTYRVSYNKIVHGIAIFYALEIKCEPVPYSYLNEQVFENVNIDDFCVEFDNLYHLNAIKSHHLKQRIVNQR